MTGFQLLQHATERVFHNIYEALAVSGLIWIGILIVQIAIFSGVDLDGIASGEVTTVSGRTMFLLLLTNVATAVGSSWIAVEWHRFALEGWRPTSAFPRWSGSRVFVYLFVFVGIALLIGLFIGVFFFLLALLFGQALAMLGGLFVTAIIGLPALYGFFRVSPVLPAIAIGEKLRFQEAWQATKPFGGAILQVSVLGILALAVVQIPSVLLGGGLVGLLYELVAGWVVLMVNVSLLSSIYELSMRSRSDG
ncbi:hypothetical protein [Celeribacter indicus]|uniref:Transmembrane protein n=1 Tax=Celeribacter indicus TaxID=1208324 RepID=A0A0B5DUP4_9RHOB|nr:hypothetical protein [Celeribacter indicus]AJE44950.1 hypothetical protein P73_0235 [Celeribacter indicus]SDW96487.1 hypothetical protein SAMN05443573_11073 [Celeribacter indicus]